MPHSTRNSRCSERETWTDTFTLVSRRRRPQTGARPPQRPQTKKLHRRRDLEEAQSKDQPMPVPGLYG